MRNTSWWWACALVVGCKSEPAPSEGREPPPPAATASPSACLATPTPHEAENVATLPPRVGGFCVDPKGSDRSYGEGSKAPLKPGICDLFDGECEVYIEHGVKRVTEARYVDGKGTAATIDVKLSRFGTPEQALAMFTKRAVGGGDPGHPNTPRPIPAAGIAALGYSNAYLWRGSELAEITVNDGELSADGLRKRAEELLPGLVKGMSEKLTGTTELPPSAKLLPAAARLPSGLKLEIGDLLVKGAGPGAFGFHGEGEKRWRVLAIAAGDEAKAKATFGVLGAGGAGEKGPGDEAKRIEVGPTKAEWLIARRGATILGVGDESLVLRSGMADDERAKRCLSKEEKRARLEGYFPSR
ncbi:MAG: hypothetical protein FJ096_19020 [Deltaproteobacteria bacterium]|nr:hypothetical protein [Deltaproteobacteria bacterium]